MKVKLMVVAILMSIAVPITYASVAGAGSATPNAKAGAVRHAPTSSVVCSANPCVLAITFNGAYEAHVYSINASGGTQLQVSTEDCCVAGDHWGVFVADQGGGSTVGAADKAAAACGTGDTTKFTGKVGLGNATHPYAGNSKLVVTYCSGVDTFPAGMTVKITYNGSLTVTSQP